MLHAVCCMLHAVLHAECYVQHAILIAQGSARLFPPEKKTIQHEVHNLSKMKSLRSKISPKLIPEILGGSLERPGALLGGHVASRLIFFIVWWEPFGAMSGSKIFKKT